MTRSPRRLKQQVQDTVGEQVRDLPLHAVRLAMFGVGRALLLSDRVTRDYKEITEGGGVRPVIGRLRTDVQNTAEKLAGRVVERVRGAEDPEPAPRPRPTVTRAAPKHAGGHEDGGEISIGKPAARPTEPEHAPKHARPAPQNAKPVAEPAPKPEVAEPEPEPAAQAKPAPKPTPDPAPEPKTEAKPEPEAAAEAADTSADEAADTTAFEPKPEAKPAAPAEAEQAAKDLPVPNYDAATLPQLRARLRGLSADQVKLLREYERKHASRPDVIKMYENRIAKLNGFN